MSKEVREKNKNAIKATDFEIYVTDESGNVYELEMDYDMKSMIYSTIKNTYTPLVFNLIHKTQNA